LTDTSATDGGASWAGLEPFITAALGLSPNASSSTAASFAETAKGLSSGGGSGGLSSQIAHMQSLQKAAHPTAIPIPAPMTAQGVPGPLAQAVHGIMTPQGVAGPMQTPMPQTIDAAAPNPWTVPSMGVGSAMGGTGTTMASPSTSPNLGMPSMTSASPLSPQTADHFTTGMPNPTGAR
jgi:hypothetical protein